MLTCINCGAQRVGREGDTFACRACGYTWDVAHEQANAAYLAGQGRRPAAPSALVQLANEHSDYGAWTVAELEAAVAKRDLSPVGTGKDGRVVKADLIAALEADGNG